MGLSIERILPLSKHHRGPIASPGRATPTPDRLMKTTPNPACIRKAPLATELKAMQHILFALGDQGGCRPCARGLKADIAALHDDLRAVRVL
jgi:hypothetical protein